MSIRPLSANKTIKCMILDLQYKLPSVGQNHHCINKIWIIKINCESFLNINLTLLEWSIEYNGITIYRPHCIESCDGS